MAEEVQTYGLDATDYYEAIDKITRKNRQMADSLIKLGEKIQNADKIANQFATNFRKVSKTPEGFAAALKLLGGQYDETKDKITLTDAELAKHLKMIQEVVKAYDTDLMRSVEQFESGEERKAKAAENSSKRILAANRAYEARMARLQEISDKQEAAGGPQASRASKKVSFRRSKDEIEIADSGPLGLGTGEKVLSDKKDFSEATKARRAASKELIQQTKALGQELEALGAKYEKLGSAASEGVANELKAARSIIEEEKRRIKVLQEQEALMGRLKVQAEIRAGVERKGRSVLTDAKSTPFRKTRAGGEDLGYGPEPGEGMSSYSRYLNKEEVKAVGEGIKQRRLLREKEVDDVEKSMMAQVTAYERAEKQKSEIREAVERKGRTIRQQTDTGVFTNRPGRAFHVDSLPESRVQTDAEVKATGEGIKQRQALRLREANDVEKTMMAQVRSYEAAEERKLEIAKKAKVDREALAKREAAAAAERFRREAESRIGTTTSSGGQTHAVNAANAAGGIADLIQKQKITADRANQIIAQISGGQTSVLSGVEARVGSMARAMKSAQDDLNSFNVDGPAGKMAALSSSFVEAEERGKASSKGILISWQAMGRLFVIQALHSVVRAFMNEIQNSIDTAAQWQIKISEIRTITQDQPLAFDEWSRSVRKLSDEFGNPILEVTAGLYETISNQMGKGATAANFMARALEFSKVTGSSTANSVNLLSSAMNSFQLSSTQTERVAAIFFKTIDKGRIKADEIANTFGRVGPSAKALGVSMEEVGAALATLTIQGVSPAESMTLLNNVMNGLVKPSKEMKVALGEMGVATGEQAVQVYSFNGVLSELEKRSKGAAGELGELFTNIRGQRGATVFTNDIALMNSNLQAMQTSLEDYRKAVPIAIESPAAQLIKQLNLIQNIVTADLAAPILKTILDMSKALSDEGLSGVFKSAISVGTRLLELFAAYKGASFLVATATTLRANADRAAAGIIAQNNILRSQEAVITVASARAMALDAEATRLAAFGHTELAVALYEEAAAQRTLAVSTSRATAGMAIQSTTAFALKGALGSVVGILANPVFLLTAAISGVIYLISKHRELEEQLAEASRKAYEAAAENYGKITKALEAELSKQSEAFEKGLNRQFSAYVDFGAKVENQLTRFFEKQKDQSAAVYQLVQSGIDNYTKFFVESLNKQEEAHRKTMEAIRKGEEELDKNRQDFAERQFRRNLKISEHEDRMKNPNARGNPVSGKQVELTNKEIARLRAENVTLAKPTGNLKTDADHRERMMQNVKKIDDLLTSQADKRFSMEEEKQRLIKQTAELEKKIADDAAENKIKAEQERIRLAKEAESQTHRENVEVLPLRKRQKPPGVAKVAERERHEEETDNLTGQADVERAKAASLQAAEQEAANKKKLEELKINLANIDASLKALPTINAIKDQGIKIEMEMNRLLEEKIKKMKVVEAQESKAIDKQKGSFEGLKNALEALSKFKLDPKAEFKTDADVKKVVGSFDKLIGDAQKAGLKDQSLIQRFVAQKVEIEKEASGKIKIGEQKDREDRLMADKKEIQTRVEKQKTALIELQKKTAETAAQLGGQIGSGEQKSPIEQFNDAKGGAILEGLDSLFIRMRELAPQIIKMQAEMVAGTGQADPNKLKKLQDAYTEISDTISKREASIEENTTGTPRYIRQREIAPGQTVGQSLYIMKTKIAELAALVQDTEKAASERKKQEAGLAQMQKALDALEQSYGALNLATQAQAKSFQQLTTDVLNVVGSMQKLKATLDKLEKAPPSPGQKVPGLALGGGNMGTDTIPAMLSPGEFVINARSTRKFYGQLLAMNRYAEGGMVNFNPNFSRPVANVPMNSGSDSSVSVSVGQIIVQGNGNLNYDARQLGRALQTEIRRGTINLRVNDDA